VRISSSVRLVRSLISTPSDGDVLARLQTD
jgi:hypothetical protein